MTDTAVRFSDEAETCEECRAAEFNIAGDGRIRDPGKFEGEPLATYHAWHTSLDGGCDSECGDVEWFGWYGLIGNMIVSTDSVGFVGARVFATDEDAAAEYARIEAEIEANEEEADDNG